MSTKIACQHCDYLMSFPVLNPGQCALCSRCGHKISRLKVNAINNLMSYSLTGVILLILSLLFPFMSFTLSGNMMEITLWQAATELYSGPYKLLALGVFAFIVLFPAVILGFILLFLVSLNLFGHTFYNSTLLRLIFTLLPWSMAEVFFVAVLVSLIKLVTIAQIGIGLSFGAYLLFCLCYVKVLTLVDKHQFWYWMDLAKKS
ncbi:MAG: paraquat-inducible protein A [Gammaproteobacteria bacterium]|nr:paraquat-inducible protein A [Gammaproteobacteria bacterium]